MVLPGAAAASLGADAPGDAQYRFEASELKAVNEQPVVVLEVQMQAFLANVRWLSLEELGQQPELDPILTLLTLPVLAKPEIPDATEQILEPRPDLVDTVATILMERFPLLTLEEIMALINLPTDHLRHTHAAQALLAEGEASAVALRQLNQLCGPLSDTTTARIQALPLELLEALAVWLAEHTG